MKKNILAALLLSLALASCANNAKVEQSIEKKIEEVPATTRPLNETIKEQIRTSALTAEQKEKLLALEEKSHAEHTAVTEEIEKAKVVLLEAVLSPKMKQSELNALKNKIRSLDKKRMENGFATIAEVRKIIAPEKNVQHTEVYKAILENRFRGIE